MTTTQPKIGLVLEGGGMRGIYTVGVLDIFDEHDFMPNYIIGVSAGACNGVSYAARQKGRGYRVIIDNVDNKQYVSWSNYIKTKSLFGMDYIFDEIPHKLDLFDYDTLLTSDTEFITGVTDVLSGKPAFFNKTDLNHNSTILRASSSIPVFSPIVEYKGGKYLDGGTSNPIPVEKAIEDGCDKVIVVLTQHRGYQKQPEKFRAIYKHMFKKYPEMIRVLDERHNVYNQALERVYELEKQGKAFIIQPSVPITISRYEKRKEELDKIHQLGKLDTKTKMNDILYFLNTLNIK